MPTNFKKLSTTMKWIRILAIGCMLGYSISTLTLAISTNNTLKENITIVQDTIKNWQTGTITDIQVVQADAPCPPSYERLYTYDWGGTNDGCDCRGASTKEFRDLGLHFSYCNSTELSMNCFDINRVSGREFTAFGTISNVSYGFCAQRNNETWAEIGPTQGTTCPSGKLKCGTSDDNIFCTQEAQCPVTSIKLSNTPCSGCQQYSETRYIQVNRGEDMLPLSEIRLNEYGMCYEVDEKVKTPGRPIFGLFQDLVYDCNGEGNKLWLKFDSLKEDKLFALHNMTAEIAYLANYGFYDTGKSGADYTWFIFNRGYVPWKLVCRDRLAEIIEKSNKLDEVKTSHVIVLYVTILSTVVVGVILTLMEILNLLGCDLPCITGKEEEERQKLLKIKSRTSMIMKLILLPFQIWAIAVLSKTKNIIRYASDNSCSSDVMNSLIDRASESLERAFKSDITAIIVLCIFFIITVIQDHREKKKLQAEKNKRVQAMNNLDPNSSSLQTVEDTSTNLNNSFHQPGPNLQEVQMQPFVKKTNRFRPNQGMMGGQPQMDLNMQFQPQPIQNPGFGMQQQFQQAPQQMQQMQQQPFMGYRQNPQMMQPMNQPQNQNPGQQQIVIQLGGQQLQQKLW